MSKFERHKKKSEAYVYPHKHCEKCGQMIKESLKFCPECYKLKKEREMKKKFKKKKKDQKEKTSESQ